MDQALLGIKHLDIYLSTLILMLFGLMEIIAGDLKSTKRTSNDWIQELGGATALSLVVKPGIVLLTYFISINIFGNYQNILSHWNFLIQVLVFVLLDDLLQYWYHRSAHEYEFLWKLHRPHHQAEEMGFFVSYRNAGLYYLLMPNIWLIGICTFLGLGKAVVLGIILKQIIIISSHSTLTWDTFFYKRKWLTPIITVLERIIITPSFHHGHHGISKLDGIGNPNGNYGNMLSIWDQLFNSAIFTRQFPTALGLQNDPKEHWTASFLFPFVKSNDPKSELYKNFKKKNTSTRAPIIVELKKGEKYLWCKCGKSQSQPFCDGSHHGTKFQPEVFEAKRDGKAKLCNCKISKAGPFCDNSHKGL